MLVLLILHSSSVVFELVVSIFNNCLSQIQNFHFRAVIVYMSWNIILLFLFELSNTLNNSSSVEFSIRFQTRWPLNLISVG